MVSSRPSSCGAGIALANCGAGLACRAVPCRCAAFGAQLLPASLVKCLLPPCLPASHPCRPAAPAAGCAVRHPGRRRQVSSWWHCVTTVVAQHYSTAAVTGVCHWRLLVDRHSMTGACPPSSSADGCRCTPLGAGTTLQRRCWPLLGPPSGRAPPGAASMVRMRCRGSLALPRCNTLRMLPAAFP